MCQPADLLYYRSMPSIMADLRCALLALEGRLLPRVLKGLRLALHVLGLMGLRLALCVAVARRSGGELPIVRQVTDLQKGEGWPVNLR